jgi:hypothetical protein
MSSLNHIVKLKYLENDVNRIGKNVYDIEEKIFELEKIWKIQFEKMTKRIDALESKSILKTKNKIKS